MTALVLAWHFTEPGKPTRSLTHAFAADGEMSVLCREIAGCLEVVDGGRSLYEGIIGDLQGEILKLKAEKEELRHDLDMWIVKSPVGALAI